MTVQRGSRYEYAVTDYMTTKYADDKTPVLFYYLDTVGNITYVDYVWKNGDRLDLVANEFYGSPTLWWIITEHNPEIEDPHNIPDGYTVRIPRA